MKIDACGLSCPQPVILTMNAMKDNDSLEVLVDSQTSCENVQRLAQNKGYKVQVENIDETFRLLLTKNQ